MSESRTEEEIEADAEWRRRAADPNDPYGKGRKLGALAASSSPLLRVKAEEAE